MTPPPNAHDSTVSDLSLRGHVLSGRDFVLAIFRFKAFNVVDGRSERLA